VGSKSKGSVRGSTREGELPTDDLLHFWRVWRDVDPIVVLGVKETSELGLLRRTPEVEGCVRIRVIPTQNVTLVSCPAVIGVIFQREFGKVLKCSLWAKTAPNINSKSFAQALSAHQPNLHHLNDNKPQKPHNC
jgi:hypothetical protein